ncbi:hypothetical protein IQ277_26990 [Nostocales cyanobacterium LEGE 12452]|nr:hypothetical protein [Nostocales cyanobacterium LEGE 12452]
MKPDKEVKMLAFVPQTPRASPIGDAARSLLPRRGTSRGTARAQWLPNLPWSAFLSKTYAGLEPLYFLNDRPNDRSKFYLAREVKI